MRESPRTCLGSIRKANRYENFVFQSFIWIVDDNLDIFKDVSIAKVFDEGESTEFAGKVIAKLAQDPKIMSFTGKVVFAADYAQSNGI